MAQLPQQVRHLRQTKGMTVEKLAFASGVSVSTVQRVETGKYDPSLSTLEALAVALDTTASALLAAPVDRLADAAGLVATPGVQGEQENATGGAS